MEIRGVIGAYGFGSLSHELSDDSGSTDGYYNNIWGGLEYGFEAGADIKVGGLGIGLRYSLLTGQMTSDLDDSTLDYSSGAFMLRLGFAF